MFTNNIDVGRPERVLALCECVAFHQTGNRFLERQIKMLCKKVLFVLLVAGLFPVMGMAAYYPANFANDPYTMNMVKQGDNTYSGWVTFTLTSAIADHYHFVLCGSCSVLTTTYAPWGQTNPPEKVIRTVAGGGYENYLVGWSATCKNDGSFDFYVIEDDDQDQVLDPGEGIDDTASVTVNFPPC